MRDRSRKCFVSVCNGCGADLLKVAGAYDVLPLIRLKSWWRSSVKIGFNFEDAGSYRARCYVGGIPLGGIIAGLVWLSLKGVQA